MGLGFWDVVTVSPRWPNGDVMTDGWRSDSESSGALVQLVLAGHCQFVNVQEVNKQGSLAVNVK